MDTLTNGRKSGSPIRIWVGILLLLVAAIAVRSLVTRNDQSPKAGARGAAPSSDAGSASTPGAPGTDGREQSAAAGARSVNTGSRVAAESPVLQTAAPPALAASGRPRSPLERSPGYYPPNDPESLSVLTGRRDAPLVNLEFTGGASSKENLALMLLAGLNARDDRALHALRVTRQEFQVILWPEFPESRPVTNITPDDAWQMSIAQSVSGASRAVGGYGGRQLEFLRIESDPPTPYKNFTLHRGTQIVVRDRNTGETERLRFAPTFVERHGQFKVLTYKD